MVTLSYNNLRKLTYAYCSLPVFLFLLLWLRPIIGIVLSAMLIVSVVLHLQAHDKHVIVPPVEFRHKATKHKQHGANVEHAPVVPTPRLHVATIVVVFLVAATWSILGGQGGFWYQSDDWNSRNALFRDLITHSWPVTYSVDGTHLVYYIAHWLPAAAIGKVFLLAGAGLDLTWRIANIALLLWTTLGVALVILHIISSLKASTPTAIAACIVLPIFFATPDLLGIALRGGYATGFEKLHIEWWATNMQFSSLTTCLFWVFNQTVIPWLCTLCFLNERSFSGYLPLWVCCFFAGPYPAIGLALLMIGFAIYTLIGTQEKKPLIHMAVSRNNMLALPAICVVALYLLSNTAGAADASGEWITKSVCPPPIYFPSEPNDVQLAVLFMLVEVCLIPFTLWLCGERSPLLMLATIVLVICPFVRTSRYADFCMRTSIPSLLCLSVLCIRVILDQASRRDTHGPRLPIVALAVLLALGSVTPLCEFARGYRAVYKTGIQSNIVDPIITFENTSGHGLAEDGFPRTNYAADLKAGNNLFFDYLAH